MITQCIKTIMMWAGSICPGPGEQELGVLRREAYANLTRQRPHLTSAGSSVRVWERMSGGWWERKQEREQTKERKVEWMRAPVLRPENVSWHLTLDVVLIFKCTVSCCQSYRTIWSIFLWIRATRFRPWWIFIWAVGWVKVLAFSSWLSGINASEDTFI